MKQQTYTFMVHSKPQAPAICKEHTSSFSLKLIDFSKLSQLETLLWLFCHVVFEINSINIIDEDRTESRPEKLVQKLKVTI